MAESFASSSTWTGQVRPPAAFYSVAVRTLGCKVNQAESEDIVGALLHAGYRVVSEEDADVIVVNTCTVTAEADHKARKAIRHAHSLPHSPFVVATGCMAVREPDTLRGLGSRVAVEPDKHAVVEEIRRIVNACGRDAQQEPGIGEQSRIESRFRSRAPLKIEDGCDAYCAYCVVPFARGLPRSTPLADVVRRARELASQGVSEVVATGVNVGRYLDQESGVGLDGLLWAVAETGICRVRLSSIEPLDITKALLGVLAQMPSFCEHLHVPLQSGSDEVLGRMGRGYTSSEFEARIELAREWIPGLSVTTDVMAGFPGETAEDVAQTAAVCERIAFAKMHVFRYSRRPGTSAAEMPGQVDAGEIARRARCLRDVGDRLHSSWLDAHVGSSAEVLVEQFVQRDGRDRVAGTSRDYLKVEAPADGFSVGDLVQVLVTGHDTETALGEAVPEVADKDSVVES
ncbi:MAG: tRNA (N(6)-L-threonylcarbamoyladenosine(37)-C(2))-methylthiotransferase MtaB [Coriobacteriia bacterium]|nr:tRNA (N(6)-L-threonylcarbamoyladenosine(37)-C(2))-methylthiotransferase MtaB [Coriobacteriia bacterium]